MDEPGGPTNRLGKLNPRIGQPAEAGRMRRELPHGVYRVDAKGQVSLIVTEEQVPNPNGLAFSPDYKTLYVVSTGRGPGDTGPGGNGELFAFDVLANNTVSNRRLFTDFTIDGVKARADGVRCDVLRQRLVLEQRRARRRLQRRDGVDARGKADGPYSSARSVRQPVLRRPEAEPAVHGGEPVALRGVREHSGLLRNSVEQQNILRVSASPRPTFVRCNASWSIATLIAIISTDRTQSASAVEQDAAATASDHTIWLRSAAAQWDHAFPLGNGRMGAMVFGTVNRERIQLNEETLWMGGPRETDNPDARAALPEVRRLLFDGKPVEAYALAERKLMGKPWRLESYQSLADLRLSFDHEGEITDYERSLDLDTGVARVTYRVDGVRLHARRLRQPSGSGHRRPADRGSGRRPVVRLVDRSAAGRAHGNRRQRSPESHRRVCPAARACRFSPRRR